MTRTSSILRHGLVALGFALPAALYKRLPDPYPTHWGFSGQVDGWTPKPLGPFLVPLAMALVHGIMLLVERAGRRDEAAIGSRRVLEIVHTATLALLLLTVLVGLRVALGGEVDVTRLLLGSVGVFLAVTGNYLGKLRRNRWIGVRTPWTLARQAKCCNGMER